MKIKTTKTNYGAQPKKGWDLVNLCDIINHNSKSSIIGATHVKKI